MLYAIIAIIACWGIQFRKKAHNQYTYIHPEETAGIKGICALLVFASHSYMTLSEIAGSFSGIEQYAWTVRNLLGQLIVAPVLFFSGCGVMASIKAKGATYIKRMPKHRIFKVWVHFAVIVLLFLVYNLCVGNVYKSSEILLAFLAWEKVGNANWYVFCILALYTGTWLAFRLAEKYASSENAQKNGVLFTTIFTLLYVGVLSMVKPTNQAYWYNTAMCYLAGIMWSYFKEKIDRVLLKDNKIYALILAGLLVVFAILFYFRHVNMAVVYNLFSCVACVILVVLSLKIHIGNKVLSWWSTHMFSTFMLRALASGILLKMGLVPLCESLGVSVFYTYLIAITATTILFAVVYDLAMKKLDSCLKL